MRLQNLYAKRLTITLNADLVKQIDRLAAQSFSPRTSIIRDALIRYIRAESQPVPSQTKDSELEKVLEEFQQSMGG